MEDGVNGVNDGRRKVERGKEERGMDEKGIKAARQCDIPRIKYAETEP